MTDPTEVALVTKWQSTRSAEVARKLAALPRAPQWDKRLKELARARHDRARPRIKALPDDPRVTDFFLECMRRPCWPAANASGLWSLILERLAALRDVRAIEPLRAAISSPPMFLSARTTDKFVGHCRTALAALEKSCAHQPRLQAPPAVDPSQLVARVFARPDDDDTRRVVADALLELQDPWGEFISLQFKTRKSPTELKREQALLRKHAAHFAGPIAGITTRAHWSFEKGFLSSCQLVTTDRLIPRRQWEAGASAPHWATVKSVRLGGYGMPGWWLEAWLKQAPLRSLREVYLGTAIVRRAGPGKRWEIVRMKRSQLESAEALCDALNRRVSLS